MDVREKLVELCEDLNTLPCCDTYEGQADYLIARGVTVLEWTSVKEHLPQEDLPFCAMREIVQVLLNDGTVTVGWCNRGMKCWFYMPINATSFVGHDYDKTPVVAWQPMPQPPKEE